MTKRDRLYLTHIVECADRIESYTAEGKEAFLTDTKTQDAVLRNLEVIAEASKRLSDEAKAVHPDIEWRGSWPCAISCFTSTPTSIPNAFGRSLSETFVSSRTCDRVGSDRLVLEC